MGNPAYKGAWVHPEIDNPEYNADDAKDLGKYDEFCKIGLDLWQVKSGTIFDNFLITDDPAEAKKSAEELWGVTKDAEKAMKDQQDAEEESKKDEDEDEDDEDLDDEYDEDKDEADEADDTAEPTSCKEFYLAANKCVNVDGVGKPKTLFSGFPLNPPFVSKKGELHPVTFSHEREHFSLCEW